MLWATPEVGAAPDASATAVMTRVWRYMAARVTEEEGAHARRRAGTIHADGPDDEACAP